MKQTFIRKGVADIEMAEENRKYSSTYINWMLQFANAPQTEEICDDLCFDEIAAAEQNFNETVKLIGDAGIRTELNLAAKRVFNAYKMLGFCSGYISREIGC